MDAQPLPLKNNMAYLKERRKMAIIRYFWNKKDNEEQQIKTNILLFYRLRDEQK